MPPDVKFKAKMHKIRFRLGELTALPRPLRWIYKGGGATSKGKEEVMGRKWIREGEGEGVDRST